MLASDPGWDAPVEFHVAVDVAAAPPVVTVWGEIDLATVAPFRDALSEAVDASADEIVVDLTRVSFMGSTGIRELIRAYRSARRIVLLVPPGIVRRALETAALPETFELRS